MTHGRLTVATLVAIALVAAPGAVAGGDETPRPGPRERCAVCGMFVAKHASWLAVVVLDDGEPLFFDGPKDMFRFLQRPGDYGHAGVTDVADRKVWVTDYYTTRLIDGTKAFYVTGSDVMGPMGAELVPVATRDQAETFRADHGGDRVLPFDDVNPAVMPER